MVKGQTALATGLDHMCRSRWDEPFDCKEIIFRKTCLVIGCTKVMRYATCAQYFYRALEGSGVHLFPCKKRVQGKWGLQVHSHVIDPLLVNELLQKFRVAAVCIEF